MVLFFFSRSASEALMLIFARGMPNLWYPLQSCSLFLFYQDIQLNILLCLEISMNLFGALVIFITQILF